MLLESLFKNREFECSMDKMKSTLTSISDMIKTGNLALPGGTDNPWVIDPMYENKDCSVGMVRVKSLNQAPCDMHVHAESIEFLIVTKGELALNIENKVVRIVRAGECASIPKGVQHYSHPLTGDTEFVYVCVPRDADIPETINFGWEHTDAS